MLLLVRCFGLATAVDRRSVATAQFLLYTFTLYILPYREAAIGMLFWQTESLAPR